MKRLLVSGLLVALIVSGCGGSDEDSAESSSDPACETTLEVGLADGSLSGVFNDEGAGAVSLNGAGSYTIFVTDFPFDEDEITPWGDLPQSSEGHTVTIFLTVYNAPENPPEIVGGEVFPASTEFEVPVTNVIVTTPDGARGNNIGIAGEAKVVSVDDRGVCVDIDYRDDEKSVSGQVLAPVLAAQ